jgi:hypothetical protein
MSSSNTLHLPDADLSIVLLGGRGSIHIEEWSAQHPLMGDAADGEVLRFEDGSGTVTRIGDILVSREYRASNAGLHCPSLVR